MKRERPNLIFRKTESNSFTLIVLLNAIEQKGIDKKFDIRVVSSHKDLINSVSSKKENIILFSFMTHHAPDIINQVKSIRNKFGDDPVLIAGGPHPKGDPEGSMKIGFDVVSTGHGEATLPHILEDILENGDSVRSSFYPDKIDNIETSFPISIYTPMMSPLEITRGCFYRCTYCQTGGAKPIHRSISSAREYLEELVKRDYLFRVGFINPSGFEYGASGPGRTDKHEIEKLLRMFKQRGIRHLEYGIFPSELRPNTIEPDLLDLIVKYCSNKKIAIGGQSGSDRILRKMRRGHTKEDVIRSCALSREADLVPYVDFIIGYPDETEEDTLETIEFARELNLKFNARTQMHFFLPLAGTPLYGKDPAFLSKKVIRRLEKYVKDGVCTDWWKQGISISKKIVEMKRNQES